MEIKPDDYLAWYSRGNALLESGKLEEAVVSYNKAIEIKPLSTVFTFNSYNALSPQSSFMVFSLW